MLSVEPIPAFTDNYFWLLSVERGQHVAIVDPGDAQPVLSVLHQRELHLGAILITHHHADHIGGVSTLLNEFPDMQIFAPHDERIAHATDIVREGDNVYISCLDTSFCVMEVPGHTRSHISYYGDGKLFCGDTVFACGCGRLFEGTAEQMHTSLSHILKLPEDTNIYCGHEYTLDNIAFAKWVEPQNQHLLEREREAKEKRARGEPTVPSSLQLEKQTNPFLRFEESTVIQAAERFLGRKANGPAEVFGAIRVWKDTKFD